MKTGKVTLCFSRESRHKETWETRYTVHGGADFAGILWENFGHQRHKPCFSSEVHCSDTAQLPAQKAAQRYRTAPRTLPPTSAAQLPAQVRAHRPHRSFTSLQFSTLRS